MLLLSYSISSDTNIFINIITVRLPAQRKTSWIVSFRPASLNMVWHCFCENTSTSTSWSRVGVTENPNQELHWVKTFPFYLPSIFLLKSVIHLLPCFVRPQPTTVAVFPSKLCLYFGKQTGIICSLKWTGFESFSRAISFLKSAGL